MILFAEDFQSYLPGVGSPELLADYPLSAAGVEIIKEGDINKVRVRTGRPFVAEFPTSSGGVGIVTEIISLNDLDYSILTEELGTSFLFTTEILGGSTPGLSVRGISLRRGSTQLLPTITVPSTLPFDTNIQVEIRLEFPTLDTFDLKIYLSGYLILERSGNTLQTLTPAETQFSRFQAVERISDFRAVVLYDMDEVSPISPFCYQTFSYGGPNTGVPVNDLTTITINAIPTPRGPNPRPIDGLGPVYSAKIVTRTIPADPINYSLLGNLLVDGVPTPFEVDILVPDEVVLSRRDVVSIPNVDALANSVLSIRTGFL